MISLERKLMNIASEKMNIDIEVGNLHIRIKNKKYKTSWQKRIFNARSDVIAKLFSMAKYGDSLTK